MASDGEACGGRSGQVDRYQQLRYNRTFGRAVCDRQDTTLGEPDQVSVVYRVEGTVVHSGCFVLSSYSVYRAIDVAPALAVGYKYGLLFSAYGQMRVSHSFMYERFTAYVCLCNIAHHQASRRPGRRRRTQNRPTPKRDPWQRGDVFSGDIRLVEERRSDGCDVSEHLVQSGLGVEPNMLDIMGSTTSNEGRLREQLVPFGSDFPLMTAAEVREFELSGYGYKG